MRWWRHRWRRRASMRSFWRAISGSTRACRSACRRWWCSGCAPRASRRSCRRPTRSTLGKSDTVLCVGTESMSRNPIAAYTPSRRLQDGAGRVQGLPVGGDAGYRAEVAHGRHGGGTGQALPDHARGYGRVCRRQLRSGGEGARGRVLQGRGGAGRRRAVRAGGLPDARDPPAARREVAGRRRASAADAAGSAEGAQAGVQGRADRRQQLGHRRRRGGGRGGATAKATAASRSPASSPAPRSACRRRSWGSARRRPSAPCWPRPG